ncbi:MAG TPA: hypothetical protein VGJ15_12555, partial [Pirellulales bacterium]
MRAKTLGTTHFRTILPPGSGSPPLVRVEYVRHGEKTTAGAMQNRNRNFCYLAVRFAITLLAVLAIIFPPAAQAGGGPENMVLVVNAASGNSEAIANWYVQLRHIPAVNVVYIDWRGPDDRTDINTFREKILGPVLAEIRARNLAGQTDYIIYSSGFPWSINFQSDIPPRWRGEQLLQNTEASISSLTYFYSAVMAKDIGGYVGSPTTGWYSSNHYFRIRDTWKGNTYQVPIVGAVQQRGIIPGDAESGPPDPQRAPQKMLEKVDPTTVGSHGFHSWYGWGPEGQLQEAGGNSYMLSTVLGVTAGRGNTVPEIISYLKRSAEVDGTLPKGTIYFMNNGGIRTTTRRPPVAMVVDLINQLGVRAEILPDEMPKDKPDVQGLFCGVAEFNWPATKSTILPGAICETLTSWAGNFDKNGQQTPLSDFLRYGASGSSGTVIEPFAIQNKFPYATVQLHYARGCTLAEAYYQAVYGPYQLIIVGDPLCRPWANIPEVTVDGVKSGETLKDKVTLRPSAKLPHGGGADRFRLFVDGRSVDSCGAGESLDLDTKQFADGDHELRVVGVEAGPIESQGRAIIPVRFNNYGKTIKFNVSPEQTAPAGTPLKFSVETSQVLGVEIRQNNRIVAAVKGERGEASVDSRKLGAGPVTFQAVGRGGGGAETDVISAPVT